MVKFQPDEKINFLRENNIVLLEIIRQSIKRYFVSVNSRSSVLPAFPSALTLARASNIAYENRQEPELLNEWEVLCSATNKENQYFGRALISKSKQPYRHIIIAHRGTDPKKPGAVVADYNGILHNEITGQINSACTFVLKITEILKDVIKNSKNNQSVQLSITGHSLGGWLAQLTTYAAKHIKIENNRFINCTETDGMHAHCEVFDSPGAMPMLKRLNRNILTKEYYKLELIRKLDITVYLGTPNLVNIVNEHVGILIQIQLNESEDSENGPMNQNILKRFISKCKKIIFEPETLSSLKYHNLSKFIVALNCEETPKYSIGNWPMVILKNWDTLPSKKEHSVNKISKSYPTPGLMKVIKIYGELLTLGINIRVLPNHLKGPAFPEFIKYLEKNLSNSPPFFHKEITNDQIVNLNVFLPREDDFIRELLCWANHFNQVDQNEINENFTKILEEIKIENCDLEKRLIALKNNKSLDTILNILRSEIFKLGQANLELPNHSELKLIDQSNEYIRKLHDKYLNVDINPEICTVENLKNVEVSQIKLKICSDPNISKIQINLIRSNILNHLSEAFPGQFLIVEPNDLKKEIKITSTRVKRVVIDCLSTSEFYNIPTCENDGFKIIHLQPVIVTQKDKFKIKIRNGFFETVKAQRILFQGNECEFGSMFSNMNADLESFKDYFNKHLDKFEKLITNNHQIYEKLSVGLPPPSFFKERSNYVDVNESLNFEEFKNTFQKPNNFFICGDLDTVNDFISRAESDVSILVRITNGSLVFDQFFLNHKYNENIRNNQELDDQAIQKFYEVAEILNKNGEDRYVNLIKCSKSTPAIIDWRLQFNPYLYKERKFVVNKKTLLHNDKEDFEKFNRQLPKNSKLLFKDDKETKNTKWIKLEYNTNGQIEISISGSKMERHRQTLLGIYRPIYSEDSLLEYFENSGVNLIVADEPGMGKSTTTRKLAQAFYDKNGTKYLVLWIDLKRIKFSQQGYQIIPNSLFDLLSTNIPKNDFTEYFLKYRMQYQADDSPKICVFLDGFDEVDSKYKVHLASLFQSLEAKSIKFIVTTRSNQDDLDKLVTILPNAVYSDFEKLQKYQKFLTSFWTGLIQNTENLKSIEQFSKETIDRAEKYLSGRGKDMSFLGVPLQLRLLSEVHLKHLRIYIRTGCFDDLPDYSLFYLYKEYIKRKYEIYFEHKILPKIENNYSRNQIISSFEDKLEYLSIKILFQHDESQALFEILKVNIDTILNENDAVELCRTGIVFNSSSLDFLHRTFAEFYFAKFLLRTFKKIIAKNTMYNKEWIKSVWVYSIKNVFLISSMWVVRLFFNDLIAQEFARDGSILRNQLTSNYASRKVYLCGKNDVLGSCLELAIDEMLPDLTFFILHAMSVDHQCKNFWTKIGIMNRHKSSFLQLLIKETEREKVYCTIVDYLKSTSCNTEGSCNCAKELIEAWFINAKTTVEEDGGEKLSELLVNEGMITYYIDKWVNGISGEPPFKRVSLNGDIGDECYDYWIKILRALNSIQLNSIQMGI